MWLFSSRQGGQTVMKRRRMVAFTIFSATAFLLASVVSGVPVEEGFRLTNKEVPHSLSPEESSPELQKDVDVEDLHSLNLNTKNSENQANFPAELNLHASPSERITDDDEKRSSDHNSKSDFVLSDFTSSSDTPRDMAEYIFWTGDEVSVTNAIKDFVNQGLISLEDGKSFMEQVRHDLQQIQFRYGTTAEEKTSPEVQSETKKYIAKEDEDDTESRQLSELIVVESNKVADGKSEKPHEGEIVVTSYRLNPKSHNEPVRQEQQSNRPKDEVKMRGTAVFDVKDEHLNEAHIVDILSNEYSLEEILYQLARILFSQSLSQAGHPEAEEALKKFADFLEKESKEGKMSPQLQKKVLDVLLMSLFDSMADQHIPTLTPLKFSPMEHVLIAKDKH